jgi:hypothetical protein
LAAAIPAISKAAPIASPRRSAPASAIEQPPAIRATAVAGFTVRSQQTQHTKQNRDDRAGEYHGAITIQAPKPGNLGLASIHHPSSFLDARSGKYV